MTHRIERTMVGTIPGTLHKSLRALTSRRVTCPTRVNTCRVRPNLPRGLPVLVRSAGFELFPPTPVGGSPVLRLHRMHYSLFYSLFFPYSHGGKYIELILLQPEDRSLGCSLAAVRLSTIKPLPSQVAREACTYRTPALFGMLRRAMNPEAFQIKRR